MNQSTINLAENNIPADVGTLGVVWNDDTKEFFFTNCWGYDTTFLNEQSNGKDVISLLDSPWIPCSRSAWKHNYADKDLQKDIDLFAKKKGFTLINKVKYLVTYNDDRLYEKEYLLLLVNKMKGLL